jgi:putative membrane protein
MRFHHIAIAASAFCLTACATMAGPGSADMTPNDRVNYVAMAGASDLFEIQSSQIALSKAQRSETRQFAQMLITHHTQTTAALTAAAAASGMNPPPPMLMPMQRQMIDALQGAPAGSFDQLYIHQQVPAHEMALALHQNYAASGDAAPLRAAAASAVPIVQQHLAQARQMD